MKTNRIKRPVVVLASRVEVEAAVHDIAAMMNNEARTKAQMDKEILAVKNRYGASLERIDAELQPKLAQVQAWAEANPAEFGKKKSIDFISAIIGFRTGTPKLALLNRSWNWNTALDAVCSLLPNFIRSKPEIDKEAIISQADELKDILPQCGVKVTQGEAFYVEPKLTEVGTIAAAEARA